MPISQEAIQKILGIEEEVYVRSKDMAKRLKVTFYPYSNKKLSSEVEAFALKLEAAFVRLGVQIVPYEKALFRLPLKKITKRYFFALTGSLVYGVKKWFGLDEGAHQIDLKILSQIRFGKKIKPGISVIALGEYETGNLPIDHMSNFRESNVVTILDMPKDIDVDTEFHKHFDTAMNLFAHHMTNIVIGVDKEKWVLYNFNASHPIFPLEKHFEDNILHALIPKMYASIRPPSFSEFTIDEDRFNSYDAFHKPFIDDLVGSGDLLERTGLYPPGKSVESLPFRNEFYKWIGKIHLDHRTGMSYGFVARQLPVKLSPLLHWEEAKEKFKGKLQKEKDYFIDGERVFLIIEIPQGKFCLEVPNVWILASRSGADKTHLNPYKDVVKMGLVSGKMMLVLPKEFDLSQGYRPSFDTKVILAHALGNAIIGSILRSVSPGNPFCRILEESGLALAHWHGYLNKKQVPKGWYVYGIDNPHVSCSSPQSAIYALDGKVTVFTKSLVEKKEYMGDIHIEPHHGTNMTFNSLEDLGKFFLSGKEVAKLGNYYLNSYKEGS